MGLGVTLVNTRAKGNNRQRRAIQDLESLGYNVSKLELGGKKFGEWGNQAIEAASIGKVVITNSLSTDLYRKEYGDCALHIANSAEELETHLVDLITMDRKKLLEEKHNSRDWVVSNHSLIATAKRLKDKIFNKFFDF